MIVCTDSLLLIARSLVLFVLWLQLPFVIKLLTLLHDRARLFLTKFLLEIIMLIITFSRLNVIIIEWMVFILYVLMNGCEMTDCVLPLT